MSKVDSSLNGLVGVVETMLEAAKRLQELEQRYASNESSFQQMQKQFQQIQEAAAQFQSLADERLAAISSLSVELRARHAQADQFLADARALLEEAKAAQTRFERSAAAAETRSQMEAERVGQLAQTLEVVRALVDKLQVRQDQFEQSLLAVEALIRDQSKRHGNGDQFASRVAQIERALTDLDANQQAAKQVLEGLEKGLGALRARVTGLEMRPADASGAPGGASAAEELGARMEELRQLLDESAGRAAKAQELASQALEKATAAAASEPPVAAAAAGVDQAAGLFGKFLSRCEQQHQAAMEQENKLIGQWRKMLEALPARADAAIQRFLEQNEPRIDQAIAAWLRQRESPSGAGEAVEEGLVRQMIEKQREIEVQVSKLAGAAEALPSREWMEALEAAAAAQGQEVKFLKTLLWVILAAVGLSYALVAYAVILRS